VADIGPYVAAAEPLTAADEFELYVTRGVVPSMHAIRRALGDDRGAVLARLDERRVPDDPE
jgi:hypothetical protein